MKYWISLTFACYFPIGVFAIDQSRPRIVSEIQLIANPDGFDGSLVTVTGFLILGEHPEFVNQEPFLYLHEEDAKNLLVENAVRVVASRQMQDDREKLDHMYVTLTGVFRVSHAKGPDSTHKGTVTEVQRCRVWSNPSHPIGVSEDKTKYK